MATIVPRGIVATGLSTGAASVDLTMTSLVPRSSPSLSSFLLIGIQAIGDPSIGFGGSVFSAVISDNAPEQPCYAALYGSGNQYKQFVSVPIAGDTASTPKSDFSWSLLYAGCILHDINAGDTVTLTFSSSATSGIMKSIRAFAFWVTGILAYPSPFPFTDPTDGSGWTQARTLAWSQFELGQPSACFDGSLDAASITPPDHLFVGKDINSDESFGGTNLWTQPHLWATVVVPGTYQPSPSSWTFDYSSITEEESWFQDGDADALYVFGQGFLFSAADATTKFGGCFDATPHLSSPGFVSVHPRIWEAGDGPPYDDATGCARGEGIWLPTRHRPELPSSDSSMADSGVSMSHRFRPELPGDDASPGEGLSIPRQRYRPELPADE